MLKGGDGVMRRQWTEGEIKLCKCTFLGFMGLFVQASGAQQKNPHGEPPHRPAEPNTLPTLQLKLVAVIESERKCSFRETLAIGGQESTH